MVSSFVPILLDHCDWEAMNNMILHYQFFVLFEYMTFDDIDVMDRTIENPQFRRRPGDDTDLTNTVYIYNDGRNWKLIPLSVVEQYPIVYDKLYQMSEGKNRVIDITVCMCPFSLHASLYYEKLPPAGLLYKNNIVLLKDEQLLVPILDSTVDSNGKLKQSVIRRGEVRLMTLRNAISKYPDCLYIVPPPTEKPLVNRTYSSNREVTQLADYPAVYHPKTVIHVIEYLSSNTYKTTVLVGKDATSKEPNTIDWTNNGMCEYLDHHLEEIRERGGIIIPCYWFAWMSLDRESKVIKL